MIERIVSGGQTGADQAGWRAAKRFGIETGGWMPKGWKTEDGPRPDFEPLYGAQEHSSPLYPTRTFENARMADMTVWFGYGDSAGFRCTLNAAKKAKRPFFSCEYRRPVVELVDEIERLNIKSLNIAGNRESLNPGIGLRVEGWLVQLLSGMAFCK